MSTDPKTVQSLSRLAVSHGWTTRISRGKGTWKGKPAELVVLHLERLSTGDFAVAQWFNGKADTCWRWPAPDEAVNYRRLTFSALRKEIASD